VTDAALNATALQLVETPSRTAVLRRLRRADAAFRIVTRTCTLGVLVILGGVIVALVSGALPTLRAFGIAFLTTEVWNPVTEKFGALAPIYGTVVTSAIAMAIAVPIGLMIAMFLTELCPMRLRRPIGIAIERLAGFPASSAGSGACSGSRRSCSVPCSRR